MVSTGFAQTKNPEYPLLDTARPEAVSQYLLSRNILRQNEHLIGLRPAGRRSRNATIRVETSERSLFLKQFRPWEERPRSPGAPPAAGDRFEAELQFHRAARIAGFDSPALPALLYHDARARCLVFEDVGAQPRTRPALDPAAARSLAWFLVSLHHRSLSVPAAAHYGGAAVLRWQREKLFPVAGTAKAAGPGAWRQRLAGAGRKLGGALHDAAWTLEMGGHGLVHGEFLPANWLVATGPVGGAVMPGSREMPLRVVDAELSFFGAPEFDAGAFLAGMLAGGQSREAVAAGVSVLAQGCVRYEARLVAAFTAVHLAALFDAPSRSRSAPGASPEAERLLRLVTEVAEADSLEPLAGPHSVLPLRDAAKGADGRGATAAC